MSRWHLTGATYSVVFNFVSISRLLLPNSNSLDNDNNEATEISANQADMGMIGIRHQTLGWEYHIIRANNRTLPIMGATWQSRWMNMWKLLGLEIATI